MALTMWCLVAMLVVVANGSNIGGSVSDGSHRGNISNSGNNVNYVGGNGGVSDGGGGSKWWCGGGGDNSHRGSISSGGSRLK